MYLAWESKEHIKSYLFGIKNLLNAGSVVLHRLQHLDGVRERVEGGHRQHAHDRQRQMARHQLSGHYSCSKIYRVTLAVWH